jgi:serine/threonine protein kinase
MSVNCVKCKTINREKAKFCSRCGNLMASLEKNNKKEKILGNRYKIEKLIKSGGMGSIYRGKHIKLDETFAIKEMIFTSTDEKENQYAMKRFYEEAKILSRLRHANLPVVTDYFDEDNKYYIVMDFVEGQDLGEILKKYGSPGLPEKHVAFWTEEVLKVLDYLHSQTIPIIYRDIKPSNIMIRTSDKKVMLIDFGIARTVQGNIYSGQTAVGTFGYAPLEQYRGSVEPRSDIYALGVTMHCLLTGIEPISCDFRPVREIVPSLSEEIEKIIVKAVQEKPKDRYSSAKDMLHALKSPLEGVKQTQYSHKNLPPDIIERNIIERKKITCDLNRKKSFKEEITDEKNINDIKNIINNWGNKESWFSRGLGKKIDINQIVRENAFIISIEVLFLERLMEEGMEPCSDETQKSPVFQEPSYKSLEEFPALCPPSNFTTKLDEHYIFPDSKQVVKCIRCGGDGDITCKGCRGKGITTKTKKINSNSPAAESAKCKYCRGTGKATCDFCNGYKEIIKYLYFSTKYYPMYFSEILYNGRLDKGLFQESDKFLIYEEEIFDRQKSKSFDDVKLKPVHTSFFYEPLHALMDEISSHHKDTKKELKIPLKMKLSIEEMVIREVQFKDKKKNNTIWLYGTETEKDKLTIENRPLSWSTEDIIDWGRNMLTGRK